MASDRFLLETRVVHLLLGHKFHLLHKLLFVELRSGNTPQVEHLRPAVDLSPNDIYKIDIISLHSLIIKLVATGHDRLQVVLVLRDRASTATATVCQPVATATEFPVFSGWVQLGCSFFPVGATGPSKTSLDPCLHSEQDFLAVSGRSDAGRDEHDLFRR
jgi:hypothetical protein